MPRLLRRAVLALFLASTAVPPLHGQGIIINELYNGSSNINEWVELLVIQDSLDIRGWDIRDFSGSGGAQLPLSFTSNALWSSLKKGTIILIEQSAGTLAEDLDASDCYVVVRSTNALYLTGNPFNLGGTSDAIQIRTAADAHVFGVSWGTANASSIPSPKVHFSSGFTSSDRAAFFNGGSLAELTSTGSWTFDASGATPGAGNTPANSGWITALRRTLDGAGVAAVSPDTLEHGVPTTLAITFMRDTSVATSDIRLVLPGNFGWPQDTSALSFTNMTAAVTIAGDTVTFSGIVLNADATVIEVRNVVPPDSTACYPVEVQTKAQTSFRNVSPLPQVVVFGLPVSVAQVKGNDANGVALRAGQLVTIRGIVTVANQFGGAAYLQDNTGGIAVFGSSLSNAVTIGDEAIVSGKVDPYNGLTELTLPTLHGVVSSGNNVAPLVVTCSQLKNDGLGGLENYEGLLVRLNGVVVRDLSGSLISTWNAGTTGMNYRLWDGTDSVEVRIDNDVDIAGKPALPDAFDIVGVVGQYKTALPFIGGYQLMPRSLADIISSGPLFATVPVETAILPGSLTIGWKTISPGNTGARYGKTPALELGYAPTDDSGRTEHSLTLSGLDPATVYYVGAFSASGTDTSFASTLIASTASPSQTTGQINVYFNKTVQSSLAWFQPANGSQDLVSRIVTRINNARRSVDAALYSLSGTPGPGTDVASALVAAKNRGVKVRVVCEYDNSTTSPINTLRNNGIPVITDQYDAVNAGAGLMHNKFFVIDGRGGAPDSVWVWTGSWNPTDPGTNGDAQNSIEFQDAALAGAYMLEFNEMWGSSGDTPVQSASRFGARKTDNTPHRFVIGGKNVECYFSPSDHTTSRIIAALNGAQHSIAVGTMTLTRTDIANSLIAEKNAGRTVRCILDNNTDSGSQYSTLLSSGIDILLKTGTGYIFHHKYAVIDGEKPSWDPVVITGSHNWSSSAENSNNENTVIVHDGNVANQYLQEFAARYYQYGGGDTISVGVEEVASDMPTAYALEQNYPNPFNPLTTIKYTVGGNGAWGVGDGEKTGTRGSEPALSGVEGLGTRKTRLVVYDVLGRQVATLVDELQRPGRYRVTWNAGGLASGVYFYRLTSGSFVESRKMLLVK